MNKVRVNAHDVSLAAHQPSQGLPRLPRRASWLGGVTLSNLLDLLDAAPVLSGLYQHVRNSRQMPDGAAKPWKSDIESDIESQPSTKLARAA